MIYTPSLFCEKSYITVEELFKDRSLKDLRLHPSFGDKYLDKRILNPRIQKPGLAFAGYLKGVKPGRVQIVGASEYGFFTSLDENTQRVRLKNIVEVDIPVFIFTKDLKPPSAFVEVCEEKSIPILLTPQLTYVVVQKISFFLEQRLMPSLCVHGVMMAIFDIGVLLEGISGIGKSECALELIARGHTFIADDIVTLRRFPNGELWAYSMERQRHFMEVRGIGILDVERLFGLSAVANSHRLEMIVSLEYWDRSAWCERLGVDEKFREILGVELPVVKIPVGGGRSTSLLVEIAVKNHILKSRGYNASQTFISSHYRYLDEKQKK